MKLMSADKIVSNESYRLYLDARQAERRNFSDRDVPMGIVSVTIHNEFLLESV